MDFADLSKEFPRGAVHWRVQGKAYERRGQWSARALAYIDARDVMDRLDSVCGPENWQAEYNETPKGRVICRIGIRADDGWVWKSDGAGATQVEGEKGGISDALKRAAVAWGVGRYLYRLDSPWVRCEVNDRGQWRRADTDHGWLEDPWAKVKNVGYTQPEPEPEAEQPKEYTDAGKRDILKAVLEKQKTPADVESVWSAEKFAKGLAALPEPMRLELEAIKRKLAPTPMPEGMAAE